MATTFTSVQAATTYPIYKPVGSGQKCVAFGTIAVAANPVANDIYQMCWLPAGARVLGGLVRAGILDTNAGSETLDLDLGWAANGGTGTYDALDADGLGNFDVWKGDAFATGNISRVAGNVMTLCGEYLGLGIYPVFTKPTLIQFTCVATAATFGASQLSVEIDYMVP